MASSLVKRVLPPSWFRHLSSLRSPFTFVNGRWIRLEKFSSMGNGFTFELETLVFYGTIKALAPDLVAGRDFWVYGDDIIVPTSIANDVIAALKYIGFTPNPNKTFVKGPFRESCGGDFYGGVGVRAAYLQEVPHEPQQFIAFANALRRTCEVNGEVIPHRWSRVRRAWFRVLDALPRAIKACRGPKDLGDLVVHDDEQRWITRWRSSIRYVRVYRPVATHVVRWEGFAYDVQFAAALYGVPTNLPTKVGGHYPREILVSSRSSVMGYKVGWVPHS
jgi:hypothetical protein